MSQVPNSKLQLGKAEVLKSGADFAIIALGDMVMPSWEALEALETEGLSGTLINARFIKPQDSNLFESISAKTKFIFTIEDGIVEGGFGTAVGEAIGKPVIRIGLPDEFIPHGRREILLEKYGLTSKGIISKIKQVYGQD